MHLTGEVGHLPFFGLVFKPSGLTSSLEVVSPYGKPSTFRSSLIERVEKAWVTPFESLTVEQVRLLVGQKRGLQWLALPVLEFVDRYPDAEATFYPGDVSMAVVHAADALKEFASSDLRRWLSGDFEWMDDAFSFSAKALGEARAELALARASVMEQRRAKRRR